MVVFEGDRRLVEIAPLILEGHPKGRRSEIIIIFFDNFRCLTKDIPRKVNTSTPCMNLRQLQEGLCEKVRSRLCLLFEDDEIAIQALLSFVKAALTHPDMATQKVKTQIHGRLFTGSLNAISIHLTLDQVLLRSRVLSPRRREHSQG